MKCICGFVRATTREVHVADKRIGKDYDFSGNIGIII